MSDISYSANQEVFIPVTLPIAFTEHWTYLLTYTDVGWIYDFAVTVSDHSKDGFTVGVYHKSQSGVLNIIWWFAIGY